MQFCDPVPNMTSPSFLLKLLKAIPKLSAMVDVIRSDKETREKPTGLIGVSCRMKPGTPLLNRLKQI
jgi:hypothetical protein